MFKHASNLFSMIHDYKVLVLVGVMLGAKESTSAFSNKTYVTIAEEFKFWVLNCS